jgi:hypothetical protein
MLMCWNEEMLIMLRVLINDLDDTDPTYSDDRLTQILVVAARYVNQDIEGSYTINLAQQSITPDPADGSDGVFMNLTVMKSACLVDQGTFRTKAALAGLEARLGPATMKTLGHLEGFKQLMTDGPCGAYRAMLLDYKLGSGTVCHAVMGPFIGNTFDPNSLNYNLEGNDNRFIR